MSNLRGAMQSFGIQHKWAEPLAIVSNPSSVRADWFGIKPRDMGIPSDEKLQSIRFILRRGEAVKV